MTDKALAEKHYDKAFDYWFNQDRKAIKEARAAISHDPEWAPPHWILGAVYAQVPPIDREAALREFREAIRKAPLWYLAHYDLGRTLAKQGRFEEAIVALRGALRLKPNSISVRIELSRCLLKRGNYHEAIAALRGKPSLSPHYTLADAHLLLAEAISNSNHAIAEARAEWEFILTLDESIPAYRMARAEASKRLQETEKA
jgi:tetratricopeptide (TPR) repeat protein